MTFDNSGGSPRPVPFVDVLSYITARPDSPDGGDGSAVTEGEEGSTLGEDSKSDKGGVPPLPTAPPVPPPVSEAAGVPVAEAAITQTPGSEQVPEEPESGDEGEKALLPDFGCEPRLPTGIEWPTPRYGHKYRMADTQIWRPANGYDRRM